ncbi:MFS transporter [Blastococcus haudaquaticus]|uniref:Major Facilitator Superfamily protein n=1 Tax=Blastococcus haudaquaticus TaxID=1938745 RepID=A0A286GK75_9ACTN|nr:MFS transporter [Blastococcus haudaquaticus]SOD95499.1 Major Facilitator Superfamily protein [Blastococcus haudaquaticus]
MPQVVTGVRPVLRRGDFRRLLATRLLSQFGDGVFQAALAGTVLFNPQRAAEPADIAAGFAVLLLPYSLVGPFAGVWLDRWSRRQVLLVANVVRAGLVAVVAALVLGGVEGAAFYSAGLAVFSVNRFVLSALSAGLPHTVDEPSLVPANALSTTAGGVSTVLGGAAAILVLEATSSADPGYAAVALAAGLPYLGASAVVRGFPRPHLGPDHPADPVRRSARASARDTVLGMVAGARHVAARPPAAAALLAIGLHRLCYGVFTLMALLLYRNTFPAGGSPFPGGILGLGQVVAAAAVGTLAAAAVTPAVVRRMGTRRWVPALLVGGGAAQLALALEPAPWSVVLVGVLLGFVAQGVKICVDSTLQETVEDDYRGRVFSVYDTLFNLTFVLALVVGAAALPESGVSLSVPVVVTGCYLLAAVTSARMTRRH